MGTSDLNRLIISFPHSDAGSRKLYNTEDHHHKPPPPPPPSSSSQTPTAIDINNQEGETVDLVNSSSAGEFKVGDCEDEHPKTPRTVEHRIPVTMACPPAPKKAKRVPITRKRKASSPFFPVIRVPEDEFMVYMDAMLALNESVFVPDIVVGDLGSGDHVKRLKLLPPPAQGA